MTKKAEQKIDSGLPLMQDRQSKKAYLQTMKNNVVALKDV